MAEFFRWMFPPEFWRLSVQILMVVLLLIAVDMLTGSKLMHWLGRTLNKVFRVDHHVVELLSRLKRASDVEFNTESLLMHGMGRLVCGGILLLSVFLMYTQLLPRIR